MKCMRPGDLVELSAAGRKLLYCRGFKNRIGLIIKKIERMRHWMRKPEITYKINWMPVDKGYQYGYWNIDLPRHCLKYAKRKNL